MALPLIPRPRPLLPVAPAPWDELAGALVAALRESRAVEAAGLPRSPLGELAALATLRVAPGAGLAGHPAVHEA